MADTTARTAIFKGLNRMPYIGDGEMRDMKNLCSDAYPYLTTRKGRKPYMFDIYIPSPEGEAYQEIDMRLPEACEAEDGNIYQLTAEGASKYISGEYYYYDSASGDWIQGIKDTMYIGFVPYIFNSSGYATLVQNAHTGRAMYEYVPAYVYDNKNIHQIIGTKLKYMLNDYSHTYYESTYEFLKGKTYEYKVRVWYSWEYYTTSTVTSGWNFNQSSQPTANASNIKKYWRDTDNNRVYQCYYNCQGYWEEVEDCYVPVNTMPENPTDGMQVRYMEALPVLERKYYQCGYDLYNGEAVYYYYTPATTTSYTTVTTLPEPSGENIDAIYYYTGIIADEFAECDQVNGEYTWVAVSHPKVKRTVTVAEYITDYKDIELDTILEIAGFKGLPAVFFKTKSGGLKLLYDEKLFDINNASLEAGKKLSVAGNRLIVGESGSYIHAVDNETTFVKSGSSFSRTITAGIAFYGSNLTLAKESWIKGSAETGIAEFEIWSTGTENIENEGFKEVRDGLAVKGTNFSVEFKGKTYYLTVESASYEHRDFQHGEGNIVYHNYGDHLSIKATGVKEDFTWDNEGRLSSLNLTFASTDPHYYDVVTWKKRLWGYNKNILHGTISDIFSKNGIVDWVTGDNTYTEAISQPLWQGGDITGIAALMNGLVCFKEDCLTVVIGNYPAIMSSQTIPCRGLPPENRESIAVANECVYYMSTDGVYRFDGNIPRCISRNVKISGTEAVGASDGNKYWLSLKEENGDYALYVYDINYDIWHKEDTTQAASFAVINGEMHMAVGKEIYNLNSPQEDVNWEFELWYDEGTHRKKKYKEIIVRGNVGDCELYLKADDGEWKLIGAVYDKMQMKLIPFDCEELSLKLKGKGKCEIKSIERKFEVVV